MLSLIYINYKKISWALLLILGLSVISSSVIRNYVGLFSILALALILSAGYIARNGFSKNDYYLFLFFIVGWMYAVFSALSGGWSIEYFHDTSFLIRQAYFLIFMPVFILAGLALQYFIGKRVYELAISKGMSFVVLLLTLDVTLSVFFGDRSFKENNGYSHYFEKSVIWFLVGYVSLVLMQNRNKSIILVLTFFIFVERIAGYGVMFNAATGMILYLILLMFCLMFTFNKIHLVKVCTVFCVLSLSAFVFITPLFSEYFIDDINTYWRLESWADNLKAVIHNYGFGVGFGVSYFPDRIDAFENAYRAFSKEGSGMGMYDKLFIRGQHSSVINVAFRLGIIGVVAFLMSVIHLIYSFHVKNNPERIFLIPLLLCGFVNVSVHVGLESPPFMIMYSVVLGMLMHERNVSINMNDSVSDNSYLSLKGN